MARALSLEVIAEGVENEVQLAELRRLGCDYAQGHLFHAAMPGAEVSRLLGEGTLDYSGISPEQVVVAEQFGRGSGSESIRPLSRIQPAKVSPLRPGPCSRRAACSLRAASSGRVAFTSASVSFGSRSWLASSTALVAAPGWATAASVPRCQGGDEEAELLRVGFQRLAVGDQDQLVVGRHAELVDRGDHRVFAALAQVDALDVAEAAEHRLGAAAEQRRQQAEADVDRLDRRRATAWRGRGSSSGRRPGRGCRRWRPSCPRGRRPL